MHNETKGDQHCECNRSACSTNPATQYNHSTLKWYCESCAFDIQKFENTMPEPFCFFDRFFIPRTTDE